jgi:hypothetical protein
MCVIVRFRLALSQTPSAVATQPRAAGLFGQQSEDRVSV